MTSSEEEDLTFTAFVERPPETGQASINVLYKKDVKENNGSRKQTLILRSFSYKDPFKHRREQENQDFTTKNSFEQTEINFPFKTSNENEK